MSIGLMLKGELRRGLKARIMGSPKSEELLAEIGEWFLKTCWELVPTTTLNHGEKTLYVDLHPAAESLEVTSEDQDHLIVTANTSSAGPGYHLFVCDILHKLGERFNVSWQDPTDDYSDETGYFHSRDRKAVFKEMTQWLQALAGSFFDGTLEGDEAVTLAMPMDVRFASDARALTPLGPRDTIWLKRTAENGLNGIDFFAWWESDLNAKYFLGRALTRMWSDVRWRVPANDAERKLLQYISESLLLAYKLDEGLDYPWVEWSQILDFLDHKEPEFEFVRLRAIGEHNIGYRRGDVTVQLPGNWWIKIPGSFSNFIQDDDDAFLSVDPPKAIWFTAYTFSEDPPTSFMHRRSQPEQLELTHEEEDYVATATIDHSEENGKNYFALKSSNVCLIGRCVCTIVFKRPEERDWAVEVWRSLQPPRRVSD